MQLKKHIYLSFAIAGLLLSTPNSWAGLRIHCAIGNAQLKCALDVKQGDRVMDALANPMTLKMLKEAQNGKPVFSNGKEREQFRKSLELNRGAMKKYADKAWKQYQRRKMSAADYEIIRAKFNAGMESYQAGMALYRAGTWFSATKGRQAD